MMNAAGNATGDGVKLHAGACISGVFSCNFTPSPVAWASRRGQNSVAAAAFTNLRVSPPLSMTAALRPRKSARAHGRTRPAIRRPRDLMNAPSGRGRKGLRPYEFNPEEISGRIPGDDPNLGDVSGWVPGGGPDTEGAPARARADAPGWGGASDRRDASGRIRRGAILCARAADSEGMPWQQRIRRERRWGSQVCGRSRRDTVLHAARRRFTEQRRRDPQAHQRRRRDSVLDARTAVA